MKIVLLGFTKISYMPYMYFYLNKIDKEKNEVHLIYWARDEKADSPLPEGVYGHAFRMNMEDSLSLTKKIPSIIKYRKFATSVMKGLAPDFLIVLHSTTGITILNLLKGRYKNKYIFDYRDVTYEKNSFYRKMVAGIANNSVLTFTSSDGFRKYLPKKKRILTSHNIMTSAVDSREVYKNVPVRDESIRIAFWGLLRHVQINRQIISKLCNDKRFELHYYGRAQGGMLRLMQDSVENFDNVFYHGEYKPEDRLAFAKTTDLLHNIYDNNDKTTPLAMGNKYYDGIGFYIPQLCAKNSFMGTMSTKHGVGLECDPYRENFADDVYSYYKSLDRKCFVVACDQEFERVRDEVEAANARIEEVLYNAEIPSQK